MKWPISTVIPMLFLLAGCQNVSTEKAEEKPIEHPKISFTFDDGITDDLAGYPFKDWNEMILSSLDEADLKSIFFVMGRNKLDEKGKFLLKSWNDRGHGIANHTFSHPNFGSEKNTAALFEEELVKTHAIIADFPNYKPLFRFPYLKEGGSREKIDSIRSILSKYDYQNGYVTIDASDWYVNSRLLKRMRESALDTVELKQYRDFYVQHLSERARYYEGLSYEMNGRHIAHTLLLHHNLTSALFLDDLIAAFKAQGWEVMDAQKAFEDEVYQTQPNTVPAGESLIWSMAKASGNYEDQLRYPAEDSRYEEPKMDRLGL